MRPMILATVGLLAAGVGLRAEGGLATRLDAVARRQAEAHASYVAASAGKATAEEQRPAREAYLKAVRENTAEVLGLVHEHPGDPAVVPALRFVIDTARGGPGDESFRAMRLLEAHAGEPGLGGLCGRLFPFIGDPGAEPILRAVLDRHPDRADRGEACYWLATLLRLRAGMVRRVREDATALDRYVLEQHRESTRRLVDRSDPDALDREADGLLERIVAEFADVRKADDPRPLGSLAEGELFAARSLNVGQAAPEIVGEDHEGRPLRLGDFRGKVVLLTFSGNWCGPCVAMYPQERALLDRLKGRPFAMASVNTDPKVETLRESIARGDVAWPCWWDGPDGNMGPITTRWGVSFFPSTFVLDRDGVIRFKDLRDEDLDRAVESLVAEAEKG